MKNLFTSLGRIKYLAVAVAALASQSLTSWAGPVDLEQARGKAAAFMKEHHGGARLESEAPAYAPALKKGFGKQTPDAASAYYVFNAEGNAGYVIISGDDRTDAVLGYATEGYFSAEEMPANVLAWMQAYAEQIALLDQYAPQQTPVLEEPAIAPMLTTIWNQDAPYNGACPLQGSHRSVTGCTATALAQVMKYHEWPAEPTAAIPAYTTKSTQLYVPELAPTTFRWDEMKDGYGYSEYAPAVAELMRYCGQALQSDYTNFSTSAFVSDIPQEVSTYFGYDPNSSMLYQSNYPISEWEEIIYEELRAGRPVLHAGTSMEGGHAFVCDGYDGTGLFHFNWGWGGSYDGYYKLTLMTPGTEGIGSGSEDGYSYNQRIIVGLQPPTGLPAPQQLFTPLNEQVSGNLLYCFFQNPNPFYATAYVGYGLMDEGGELLSVLKDCGKMSLKGYNLENNWTSLSLGAYGEAKLAPGKHRIAAICKVDADDAWQRAGNKQHYFEVEIDEGGELLNVSIHPIVKTEVTGLECISAEVVGTRLKVRITVENQGDDANSVLYFYAGNTDYLGAPLTRIPLLLKGGETAEYDVYFFPQNVGKYYLWVADNDDGVNYILKREIDVVAAPENPSQLTLTHCTIDPAGVTATVEVRNDSDEPYYREIVAMLYEKLYDDGLYYYSKRMEEPGEIAPHSSKTFSFRFDGIKPNSDCYIYIGYYEHHAAEFTAQLGVSEFFTTGTTAIHCLPAEAKSKGTVFGMDGKKAAGLNPKGIYIINGEKRIVKGK